MRDKEVKAKVFICCGQRCGTERQTAERIAQALEKIGFKTYVAVEQQRLEGFRENIFRNLEDSEYFVFVDFKRERLDDGPLCRGSLFCHQELAVSSYIARDRDIDILAFHEKGVMSQDGMANVLIVNSQEFADRHLLPEVIAYRVEQEDWQPQWERRLALTTEWSPKDGKYCHITVENLHGSQPARNCYGYPKEIRNTSTGDERVFDFERVELKWALSKVPNIAIFPKSSRRLDAFWVCDSKAGILLSTYADVPHLLPEHIIDEKKAGTYKLTYVVISENFPDAEITCELKTGCDGKAESFRETQTND